MKSLDPDRFKRIVFFTGAGMSAECGIPTYRGKGGIWAKYNWQEVACQDAFNQNPQRVLEFYEMRRSQYYDCQPHRGHHIIARLESQHPDVTIVTQNIDGMHQRAGSKNPLELHGNIWRLRCPEHGISEDHGREYTRKKCPECQRWLRPDIVWFGDPLNEETVERATGVVAGADLFLSIGTSGSVWPAAGFHQLARQAGALCIEINPEESEVSRLYDSAIREPASRALSQLFDPAATVSE